MTNDHAATIRAFYEAFGRRDGGAMQALYAPAIRFSDPVFGELRGDRAGAMWRMLTGQAQDLRIELAEHDAGAETGRARWIAHYTFSRTGRPVVNDVRATFRFAPDGRIAEHDDRFGLWRWTRQALGTSGLLLGWSPLVQGPVRKQAAASLDAFCAQEATA
jgi:ketosteroid isomerase-like protein